MRAARHVGGFVGGFVVTRPAEFDEAFKLIIGPLFDALDEQNSMVAMATISVACRSILRSGHSTTSSGKRW